MNKKNKDYNNWKLKNLLKFESRRHKNCLIINAHNSLEHELAKFKIFWKLKKNKYALFTEARFKNGGIADIVAIKNGNGYIIEIKKSEKNKKTNKKYPELFELIEIDAENDAQINKFEL